MSSYTEGQVHQLMEAFEKTGFIPNDITLLGQFPDLLKIRGVVRGERTISGPLCKWREQDSVIYLSVISDGVTGLEWVRRLRKKGFRLSDYVESILLSLDFKPTKCVTYEIAILKGILFEENDRTTKNIRAEADKRKLEKPNAEVACLIRENFSDKEIEAMGLKWVITMHEPIKDSDGNPNLLNTHRYVDGLWLNAYYDSPSSRWDRDSGFAFAVPQVSSQS
jgi:hypothetical protein